MLKIERKEIDIQQIKKYSGFKEYYRLFRQTAVKAFILTEQRTSFWLVFAIKTPYWLIIKPLLSFIVKHINYNGNVKKSYNRKLGHVDYDMMHVRKTVSYKLWFVTLFTKHEELSFSDKQTIINFVEMKK